MEEAAEDEQLQRGQVGGLVGHAGERADEASRQASTEQGHKQALGGIGGPTALVMARGEAGWSGGQQWPGEIGRTGLLSRRKELGQEGNHGPGSLG